MIKESAAVKDAIFLIFILFNPFQIIKAHQSSQFTIIIPIKLLESSFEEVAEIGYGVGNSYFTLVIGSLYLRNNLYGLFGVKAVGIIGE